MGQLRRYAVIAGTSGAGLGLFHRPVIRSLKLSLSEWQRNPARMFAKCLFSLIVGQGPGWIFGSNQIRVGIGKNPLFSMGQGQNVARRIYPHLPDHPAVIWSIKAVEIGVDGVRGPLEMKLFLRSLYTPDIVCTFVTPPGWPIIEAMEKIAGVLNDPDRVYTYDELIQAIANIYGSLFRIGQWVLLWHYGDKLYQVIGVPLEGGIERSLKHLSPAKFGMLSTTGVLGGAWVTHIVKSEG